MACTYIGSIAHHDRVRIHVDGVVDNVFSRRDVDDLFAPL